MPYHRADMHIGSDGDTVRCRSRRRATPEVTHDIRAREGRPLTHPSDLGHWLTGRWRARVRRGPFLATVPVQHDPWPLHRAEVLDLDESMLSAVRLPEPTTAPLVHASQARPEPRHPRPAQTI
jgi:uncharacterized protein